MSLTTLTPTSIALDGSHLHVAADAASHKSFATSPPALLAPRPSSCAEANAPATLLSPSSLTSPRKRARPVLPLLPLPHVEHLPPVYKTDDELRRVLRRLQAANLAANRHPARQEAAARPAAAVAPSSAVALPRQPHLILSLASFDDSPPPRLLRHDYLGNTTATASAPVADAKLPWLASPFVVLVVVLSLVAVLSVLIPSFRPLAFVWR